MKQLQYQLLRESKHALQFLHEAKNFDLEKDFVLMKIDGRFTFNQVKKEIEKHYSNNYSAAILVKANEKKSGNRKLYFADMNLSSKKFVATREDKYLPYWKYNIDYCFSVGDFEEMRKEKTDHVYIIAQKFENLYFGESKRLDLKQRFELVKSGILYCSNGYGQTRISEIKVRRLNGSNITDTIKTSNFYGDTSYTDISQIIDNSGYLVKFKRDELKQAAKKLRTEREKAAFLNSDYSSETENLNLLLSVLRHEILEYAKRCFTYEQLSEYEKVIREYKWLIRSHERHTAKLENKDYSSVSSVLSSFEKLRNEANEIRKMMEEK